jgi:hypothetical protein
MAQDIVGSLFGMTQQPDYSTQDYRTAIAMAEMNSPQQFGRFLGGMIGAPVGRAVAQGVGGLLGVQDPRLQQASIIREAQQQGFDVTTPEGLQQLAQFFVQRGQPGLASQVATQAQTMSRSAAEEQFKQAQIARQEALTKREDAQLARQDKLEQVMQELGPNASPKQIQQAIFPYLSSEEKVKLLTSKYAMGTGGATATADGSTIITGAQMGQKTPEGAPFVVGTDKVGRVKLSDGRVIPAAQFYAAQDANNQAQFALDAVLSIDENTVKQAFGSAADYTEIPYGGAIRPTTASAQTNIKNLKIKDTLEKLGPLKGATSDREFATIMSSFPAFTASPKVMQEWLDRAEKYLRNRVKTGQKQFGVMETASPEEPKKTSPQVIKLD